MSEEIRTVLTPADPPRRVNVCASREWEVLRIDLAPTSSSQHITDLPVPQPDSATPLLADVPLSLLLFSFPPLGLYSCCSLRQEYLSLLLSSCSNSTHFQGSAQMLLPP